MTIKIRIMALVSMIIAAAAGTLLFWTAQHVQSAESRLRDLHASTAADRETARVLEAEWSYLNQPGRLEDLAKTYLDMRAANTDEIGAQAQDLPSGDREQDELERINISLDPVKMPTPPQKPARAPISKTRNFNDLLTDLEGAP